MFFWDRPLFSKAMNKFGKSQRPFLEFTYLNVLALSCSVSFKNIWLYLMIKPCGWTRNNSKSIMLSNDWCTIRSVQSCRNSSTGFNIHHQCYPVPCTVNTIVCCCLHEVISIPAPFWASDWHKRQEMYAESPISRTFKKSTLPFFHTAMRRFSMITLSNEVCHYSHL